MQFIEAKQAQAESLVVFRLIALQGHTRRYLNSQFGKLAAILHADISGVADHYAGCLEALRGDAFDAPTGHQGADFITELLLLGFHFIKSVGIGFLHHFVKAQQRISRHRRVVGMAALLIGAHNRQPLVQVTGEAGTASGTDAFECQLAHHHQPAAG